MDISDVSTDDFFPSMFWAAITYSVDITERTLLKKLVFAA